MTRRLFWLAMGITIGALIVRKLTAAAQRLTPRGLAETVGAGLSDLAVSIREFSVEVRSAMAEREAELREGTGLDGSLENTAAAGVDPISEPIGVVQS